MAAANDFVYARAAEAHTLFDCKHRNRENAIFDGTKELIRPIRKGEIEAYIEVHDHIALHRDHQEMAGSARGYSYPVLR